MYEVHGWFGLAESTFEEDDDVLAREVSALRKLVEQRSWPTLQMSISALNGSYFLTIVGSANRRRDEAEFVGEVVDFARRRLPGSWGLLYERDDEMPSPPGPNAYRVAVLARGEISYRDDPFLSPCMPTIED